jgi:hypothetical protein
MQQDPRQESKLLLFAWHRVRLGVCFRLVLWWSLKHIRLRHWWLPHCDERDSDPARQFGAQMFVLRAIVLENTHKYLAICTLHDALGGYRA